MLCSAPAFLGASTTLEGTTKYTNGDVYEGQWHNDLKEGKGKMIRVNGEVYEGDWKNGKMHGYGTLTYNNVMIGKRVVENRGTTPPAPPVPT